MCSSDLRNLVCDIRSGNGEGHGGLPRGDTGVTELGLKAQEIKAQEIKGLNFFTEEKRNVRNLQ